jgi:uncharacterized delta-60 repeat protein
VAQRLAQGASAHRRIAHRPGRRTAALSWAAVGRSIVVVILCAGVASCSLLSGASDLVVVDDGPGGAGGEAGVIENGDAAADGSGNDGAAADASTGPPSGSADTTYAGVGRVLVGFGPTNELGRTASLLPDGTLVVAGRTGAAMATDYALARLTPQGALDTAFGTGGKVTLDFAADFDECAGVAHTSDGHILAMGRSWNVASGGFVVSGARLDPTGALDKSFATLGRLQSGAPNTSSQDGTFALVLRPGDAPAVGGSQGGNVIVSLFLATGAIDDAKVASGTATGGPGVVRAMAWQPDGKLVLAGWTPPYAEAPSTDVIVERRLEDLTLDAAFGMGGRVTVNVGAFDHAYGVALAPDGKIVVAGDTRAGTGTDDDVLLLRFTTTGQPDPTFGAGGRVVTALKAGPSPGQDRGRAVAIDGSGRILVAGSTTTVKDQDALLLRYTANGALDTSFGDQGVVAPKLVGSEEARDIRLMADGRIVLVGSATSNGATAFLVQRFWP